MSHLRPIDGGGEDAEARADVEAIVADAVVPVVKLLADAAAEQNMGHVRVQLASLRIALDALDELVLDDPQAG